VDSELKYPNWQAPLREAVLEFDREKLAERIQKLKGLIFDRLEAMSSETDHQDERQALADAISTLRVLKAEKLSKPGETDKSKVS